MEYDEYFMYRDTPVVVKHFFGWQYIFQYGQYYYYAFYIDLEHCKEGAIRQIDKLVMEGITENENL